MKLGPQPGPQTKFLSTSADIALYGGAAGAGKTWAELLEPLRHINNPRFSAVVFRRTYPEITNSGGLWDESMQLYPHLGAKPRASSLDWKFPSGATIRFAHLQHAKDILSWQGSQIPLIEWDELTHFTMEMFFYLLSRNRSTCGVRPYMRATCNPDPDSWVRDLVDWWIDDDGFPIYERSGQIRYMARQGDNLVFADNAEELEALGYMPKTFTFIPGRIDDNAVLMKANPEYKATLMSLPRVERERLLNGNWDVRPQPGDYFQRGWFEVIDECPPLKKVVRSWDRGATVPSTKNPDPDWTVGLEYGETFDGRYVVMDVQRARERSHGVRRMIKNIADQDGPSHDILLEEEGGSSGKADVADIISMLSGHSVKSKRPTGDKETRAKAVSAQAEAGKILVLRGRWNEAFFKEVEGFPDKLVHDDQVDALSQAHNYLAGADEASIMNFRI